MPGGSKRKPKPPKSSRRATSSACCARRKSWRFESGPPAPRRHGSHEDLKRRCLSDRSDAGKAPAVQTLSHELHDPFNHPAILRDHAVTQAIAQHEFSIRPSLRDRFAVFPFDSVIIHRMHDKRFDRTCDLRKIERSAQTNFGRVELTRAVDDLVRNAALSGEIEPAFVAPARRRDHHDPARRKAIDQRKTRDRTAERMRHNGVNGPSFAHHALKRFGR